MIMTKASNILKFRAASDVQVIRDASTGAPAFAVVPWADYQRLTAPRDEDAALIAAGEAARNDETFPEDVARRLVAGEAPLKVIREWRGMTQSQLGGKSRVPSQYISQIERRARHMGRAVARRLAQVLDVSYDLLLDD
jgi:hypothetical protein